MATIPTLTYSQSEESLIQQLINLPVPADADLFDVADRCAALASVLLETDDTATRTTLCERLVHSLHQLRERCDADLPPHLITQLIAGEKLSSCVPECWQESTIQLDYALALTQAIMGGTLPDKITKELTGLLHDMVWLLAAFVKEPRLTAH